MSTRKPTQPLAFEPAVEHSMPGEAATHRHLVQMLRGVQDKTSRDYGHAPRAVHAKSHALLEGELQVLDGLPAPLAQGMFATPACYPVVLRFSTVPGDILDDTVSTPRGLAIKIIGVAGERLPGSEGDVTQDFVMVNGPAFAAPTAEGFGQTLGLLAATTDTGQLWKKALSAVLRGAVRVAGGVGLNSNVLKAMGGQPLTHPLGEAFYTQTPFRYGDYIAKLCLAPLSPQLRMLRNKPVHLAGKPNGLRGAMIDFFSRKSATWELRVQLRTDAKTMPVEDASIV